MNMPNTTPRTGLGTNSGGDVTFPTPGADQARQQRFTAAISNAAAELMGLNRANAERARAGQPPITRETLSSTKSFPRAKRALEEAFGNFTNNKSENEEPNTPKRERRERGRVTCSGAALPSTSGPHDKGSPGGPGGSTSVSVF